MLSGKDYTSMTLEDLMSEEKKIASRKTMTALFIGLVVGVAIWAATHGSFFLTVALLAFALWFGRTSSQTMKNIQAEISRRETVQ